MAETELVDGRYRLLERLGAGGTWLAKDELLGRRVAIRAVADSAGLQAAARLDHPGIIHVFDLIRWRDAAWIVTEFVPSGSLHDAAPLSHRVAARIGLEAMAALRVANAAGIRHGNIKPQNILLADDGRVILSDFGGTAEDLPALGAALRIAVDGRTGALDPVIDAMLDRDPAGHLEPMLRTVATERSIGVVSRNAIGLLAPAPVPSSPFGATPLGASLLRAPRLRSARRRPRRGLARSTRVTLLVAASLLIGTAGTALALDAAAPPPTRPARPAPQVPICDDHAAADAAVGTDQIDHRYALPSGWLWHRDPTGFVVAVPHGWTRATNGAATCFRDPDGSRSFAVAADAVLLDSPLAQWQAEERSALTDGSLPGYRRVAMAAVDHAGSAADWEFTWEPAAGVRKHERRLLLDKGGERAYVVAWTTREQDWTANEPLLKLIVASLS